MTLIDGGALGGAPLACAKARKPTFVLDIFA